MIFFVKSHHLLFLRHISSTVQTTSSLHLGTVSGKVADAVLLLKMIGCVVLAVLARLGGKSTKRSAYDMIYFG